nr:hypothetical protein [uncultured Porphyromonas sp.]
MSKDREEEVGRRFFAALKRLKEEGVIKGKKTFTDRYEINRWNLNSLEKRLGDTNARVPASWLSYLAEAYAVSPRWLLTGVGDFYAPKPRQVAPTEPPK